MNNNTEMTNNQEQFHEIKVTCEPMSPNIVTTFRIGNTEFTVKNVTSPKETQKREDACFTVDDLRYAFNVGRNFHDGGVKTFEEHLMNIVRVGDRQ